MKRKTIAQQLAEAAIKIAVANHYLIGFDPATTEGISWDDYHDAYQILVERESKDTRTRYTGRVARKYDLALQVLSSACMKAHNCQP